MPYIKEVVLVKIGVALSGGGVRGAAHIGVLKALHEGGVPIHAISGTSSGSIVACMYAAGYTPWEIEELFLRFERGRIVDLEWRNFLPTLIDLLLLRRFWQKDCRNIVDIDFAGILLFIINWLFLRRGRVDGFVRGDVLEAVIREYCVEKNIKCMQDVKMPLAIPAVDINSAETVMFISYKVPLSDVPHMIFIDEACVWEAVRASAAFPVVFKPKMLQGRRLVDGGISDNVPVKILKKMGADCVLAVNLGYAGHPKEEIDNIFEIASQSIDIMGYQLSRYKLDGADYVFKPKIYDVTLLETSRIQECIDRAYIKAKKEIPKIREALGLGAMYVR